MSWYRTLGLESDASVADVKRAYAEKLKKTRPDVDPEGFQRLHKAYKQALAIAKIREKDIQQQDNQRANNSQNNDTKNDEYQEIIGAESDKKQDPFNTNWDFGVRIDPSLDRGDRLIPDHLDLSNNGDDSFVFDSALEHFDEDLIIQSGSADEDIDGENPERGQNKAHLHEDLKDKINHKTKYEEVVANLIVQSEALYKKRKTRDELSNWEFLTKEPMMLNDNVNFKVGLRLFELCASEMHEYEQWRNQTPSRIKNNKSNNMPLSQELLDFFAGIFSWQKNRNSFQHKLGYVLFDAIEPYLNNAPNKQLSDVGMNIRGGKSVSIKKAVNAEDIEHLKTLQTYITFMSALVAFIIVIFVSIDLISADPDEYIYVAAILGVIFWFWRAAQKKRAWAIGVFGIVCSAVLFLFPIGTIAGGYGLYYIYKARNALSGAT